MVRKGEKKTVTPKKQNHKKASFKFHAPEAQNVQLAGDFNAWDPHTHPLKRDSRGLWKININLSPGRYEYRFLVDGQWQDDPTCETCAPNPFGSLNSVIELK